MRIGIDFHFAEKDGTSNCSYIRNLVESLVKIDKDNEYYLYITDLNHSYYKYYDDKPNVKLRLIKTKFSLLRVLFVIGYLSYKDRVDVLHVQYNAPLFYKCKLVVTIHDLAYYHFPQCFKTIERLRLKLLIPLNIKIANKIIAASESTKYDIQKTYNADISKITTVYYGISKKYFLQDKNISNKIVKKYGVNKDYILFLGRLDARKNITGLIQAFNIIKNEVKNDLQLVIVGKKDFKFNNIRETINNSPFKNDIIITDYVPDNEIPYFYSNALVFVYPSLYEGFGFPVLEAMACGCNVITTNISSLPEIANNNAILVEPNDYNGIVKGIKKILTDKEFANKLVKSGKKNAKNFNWITSAEKVLNLYKEVNYK